MTADYLPSLCPYYLGWITVGGVTKWQSVFFIFVRYSTMSVLGEFRSMTTSITTNLVILRNLICASRESGFVFDCKKKSYYTLHRHGWPHSDNVDRRAGPLQTPSQRACQTSTTQTAQSYFPLPPAPPPPG